MSVVLAATGIAAVVSAPPDQPSPARLDVPLTAVVPGAPSVVSDTGSGRGLQLSQSNPLRVLIPALGVTSHVMHLGLERDGSMEVPPGAYPVGWYDRGPTPGELGPAVLAGHVDWHGDRGVFYGLQELLPGDPVIVYRADGGSATFAVDRVEAHEKDEFPTDEVYGSVPYAGLRLITCGGEFHEDTGDYEDNVIVFATLVAANGPGLQTPDGTSKWD